MVPRRVPKYPPGPQAKTPKTPKTVPRPQAPAPSLPRTARQIAAPAARTRRNRDYVPGTTLQRRRASSPPTSPATPNTVQPADGMLSNAVRWSIPILSCFIPCVRNVEALSLLVAIRPIAGGVLQYRRIDTDHFDRFAVLLVVASIVPYAPAPRVASIVRG